MRPVDLLIVGAGELVTMAGGPRRGERMKDAAVIPGGALAARDGRIVAVGPEDEVLRTVETGPDTRVIDARGRAVIPGFVDPHTHLCFAGDRAEEFALRLGGATYQEIAARGGGILETVRATRAASQAELVELGLARLDQLALNGTTTVEVKSGYGLSLADELKQLRAIRAMARRHPLTVVPTFMGAHEVPPEYRSRREAYVDLLVEEMLPAVAAEPGLARFADVFTEAGVFSVAESRRILERAKALGFGVKVHADELSDLGGAALAAELGAISAEHLLHASDEALAKLAEAGTVAVCLPGTSFCLMNAPYARARRMIELGCTVALGSDYNPGSCPAYAMPFIITLACMHLGLNPSEALAAATINAAAAIGMEAEVGSLEVGKLADVVILSTPTHWHIPYHMGMGVVAKVVKRGRLIVDEGKVRRR
ncbi:imidazolonepropionase [Symbiobacterium thermophilum]|uniref:Imidazolonepropionase n=1 Tax=Symbiobacterium thermophilum (strain DSM 24528 / JCM 14929 / IAM 14863 / T) TaxID=292459 RepID=HUTI_SYMTH|nr:imidazolonepropionase [Symbiobacterium thermophilum]Q67JH7.1 RecName: Full=Imidazolonepropionase; AltName: Full=Imidazolone-5-propionate hydrolase [Symbiobacterium thermophilum IAM 14863]BAD42173.1 imidazolonepropionase [Symbiobacterium thermophilum IAM 14863]